MQRVVEIYQSGQSLHLYRGFLQVRHDKIKKGEVALDEIGAVILSASDAFISKNILARLGELNIPVIVSGDNYHPIATMLPVADHYIACDILHQQIAASTPLKKRLWQYIVKAKIRNQADLLKNIDENAVAEKLYILAKNTTSGDEKNMEAQAARHYWPLLFHQSFTRQAKNSNDAINAMLNYGYAILRAATARAVCGAGLNPSLGLHHHNKLNPFCLVDDLMEPYRPLIDWTVYFYQDKLDKAGTLTPEMKQQLIKILDQDLQTNDANSPGGVAPLRQCLIYSAQSLKTAIAKKSAKQLFLSPIPPFGQLF